MNYKLKNLSVALFAVLALSAVAASAVMAEGQYTASSYPTTGTGTSPKGNDIFTTEGGTVECASHFEATLNAASSSLTVKPTYTGCVAFGFVEATVSMGSCDYLFGTPTNVGEHVHTVTTGVKCTNAANPIKIAAASCEVTVGEQNPGGHLFVWVDTTVGPDHYRLLATFTGIKYTVTKDGFLCPFAGTGVKTGGTYTQEKEVGFKSTNGADLGIS